MKNENKTYEIKTRVYMKDYNCEKFFIMSDYVDNVAIDAPSVSAALQLYREKLDNEYGIEISDHAIKNREYIYNNAGNPCGYAMTGKTLIADRSANYCGYQYIDVYARINVLSAAF